VLSAEVATSARPFARKDDDMPYQPLDLSFLMTSEMKAAIEGVKLLIAAGFPEATFAVEYGEDPVGVYLIATIDLEDLEEVRDLYRDRIVDLQVDEGLRLYVMPTRAVARARDLASGA
jgi:hypothetical protein